MAKQEVGRAAQGLDSSDLKQQDVAQLLKKKVVEQQADAAAPAADAASAEMVASADSVFASDASVMVAAAGDAGAMGGLFGGASTGTVLAVGAAVVGGGILIANASNDNNDGGGEPPVNNAIKVTADKASVNEGGQIIYTVEGTPGQVFAYTFNGTGISTSDYNATPASQVTIGSDGKAFITVTVAADLTTEGAETLHLVGSGTTVDVAVAIADTSVTPPEFIDLTENVDKGAEFDRSDSLAADVFTGIVDPAGTDSTYTVGDDIIGNGTTILNLLVSSNGTAENVKVTDFAIINITNDNATSLAINAGGWNDIANGVHLADGDNGLFVHITNANEGLTMAVDGSTGVSGSISATYDVGDDFTLYGELLSDGNGDSLLELGSDAINVVLATSDYASATYNYTLVTGTEDLSVGTITANLGESSTFSLDISRTAWSTSGSGDITIGNITGTLADNAEFDITIDNSVSTSGNVTVGDITVTGGDDNASFSFSLSNDYGDVTIGNVDVALGTESWYEFTVDNTSTSSGDLTVGDFAMDIGASGTWYIQLSNSNDGAVGGDLTMGDINIVLDHDAGNSDYTFEVYNTLSASTSGATGGDLAVGNISLDMGDDAYIYMSFENWVDNNNWDDVVGGNLTAGNIDATLGIGASFTAYFYNYDYSGTGTGTLLGDLTVGDISVSGDDGTYFSISISNDANEDNGNVVVGDVAIDLGVDASFSMYVYEWGAGDLGDLTVGNVDIDIARLGDSNSTFSVTHGWFATADDIGDTTVGNISVNVGDDDGDTMYVAVRSYAGNGDAGATKIGTVDLTATDSASISFSVSTTADGDTDGTTVGNITANVDLDSTVNVTIYGSADDGLVDLANVTVNGSGDFNMSVDADGVDIQIDTFAVNVTISTGTGSDEFADFLTGTITGTTSELSIDTIDFSGVSFTDSATVDGVIIDFSAIDEVGSVIGSSGDDDFIDNVGHTSMTGGDGADLFEFDIGNTGKADGKVDIVTDFSEGDGDILQFDVTDTTDFSGATYGEVTATGFADFLSKAATSMTSSPEDNLVVGFFGGNAYVAIDKDDGDAVDFVVQLTGVTNASQIDFADFDFV